MVVSLPYFVSACVSCSVLGTVLYGIWHHLKLTRQMKAELQAGAQALSYLPECQGIAAKIIVMLVRKTFYQDELLEIYPKLYEVAHTQSTERLIVKSGCANLISKKGFVVVRMQTAGMICLVGCIVGSFFSKELSILLGIAGLFVGWQSVVWALKNEVQTRSESLEKSLSEMIEIICLGLRSGLTFDRSLTLYHEHFSNPLAQAMSRTQDAWTHGLMNRDQALREMAQSYDSMLFLRVVENIVRSLRFGSSLADSLDACALEARNMRKSRMEEKVAKAPVKMMIPTGTLILPAMLIVVLGPVMLDLITGF